ncbi:UDP-N-acetylmuramoyl-L-alanyl-D-glutamate-lysine ligase [Scardovia inopinata]|uniref:UDP-N-acetylmuramyl-tripeptide synthetase n=1 Tax=Scardovia inopinata F0304 TaxID=641146 RepID=W5IJX9_SCAIO|nr:Mur ligase family protein [Scardovia inopinata]EFG27318.1 UDP-N-acetylmuramyl-tripeptide synthetase [Scardovia inopinata F0304]SUV50996.1 UDP-N-acetylmuramoyl-L-alanyl-D-glutamate-lysine ligase [Scardovia inopinata]
MTHSPAPSPSDYVPGSLTLSTACTILRQHGLLKELIHQDSWTDTPEIWPAETAGMTFTRISYDTRQVDDHTLLFCKGRFHSSYLDKADQDGLPCYVAENDYSQVTRAIGIIVTDIKKAMSLLSSAFYRYPAKEITVIGITGTKGKTTTAYFTHAILNAYTGGKAALLSSVDNCLDGHTFVESDLTTPESLDLFRMMRQAVSQGMKYLIMEVSSQAYKVDRVYGLTFALGAFLNISPDHISPIEHPSFEDYFYCKRQIALNSSALVLNADMVHSSLVTQDAGLRGIPVTTFRLENSNADRTADLTVTSIREDKGESPQFQARLKGKDLGRFSLSIPGDFNGANAAAALALISACGLDLTNPHVQQALQAMEKVTIAGRMEIFSSPDKSLVGIVDYAHNGVSASVLLDYIDQAYGRLNPRIILVTGSAGNKAYDRRQEIVEAAQNRISRFIFTEEDTDTEPIIDICQQMDQAVSNPQVEHGIILSRSQALQEAFRDGKEHARQGKTTVIAAIGKGNERWIKHLNKHVVYQGDDRIMKGLLYD